MRILISLFCLFPQFAWSETNFIKVAIIDSGFGYEGKGKGAHLCPKGHKDFTGGTSTSEFNTIDPVPRDRIGHGTNIAGVIDGYAKTYGNHYCLIILKIFTNDPLFHADTSVLSADAIKYARKLKVDVINYSGGGYYEDPKESRQVKLYLDEGGTFVAAAGNNKKELGQVETDELGRSWINEFYPAMSDKRVIVTGNKIDNEKISSSSNYGDIVTRWEIGEKVEAFGIVMSGTSQATAVASGKITGESQILYDRNKKILALGN